ncbi:MAG: hypothetical protein ACI88H_002057 [Cocleimonas sp.]|jgi:hypothetical protein
MKKLLVVSIALLMASSAQAGLYRWVDDNGKVHFSDKVPASISQKTHTKLNKSGDVTGKVDPAAKQKKLELLEAKKKEKEQLAEIRRVKAQAQAEIQQKDDNLLSTYEDEDELVRYFTSKIKMVKGNSKILEAQNDVLSKKVVKLETKASTTKHDPTLKNIAKKIVNINKTLEQYQKALVENDKQLLQLTKNYQTDLTRYKELTQ